MHNAISNLAHATCVTLASSGIKSFESGAGLLCLQLPHMIPYYNFLRKPPADFGWDWGPALAPAGIYGGVLLVAYNTVYITGAI